MGTPALPERELPLLQRLLIRLALQAKRLLCPPDLAATYPTVPMPGLSASLQYADVLDLVLAEASGFDVTHRDDGRRLHGKSPDLTRVGVQPRNRRSPNRAAGTALSPCPGPGTQENSHGARDCNRW